MRISRRLVNVRLLYFLFMGASQNFERNARAARSGCVPLPDARRSLRKRLFLRLKVLNVAVAIAAGLGTAFADEPSRQPASEKPDAAIAGITFDSTVSGTDIPPVSIEEMNAIYDFGRRLFDDYAPEQIKEQYDFMSREDWNALIAQFHKTLETGTLEEIASLEPKAKRTLEAMRAKPDMADYADWFAERLELILSAKDAIAPPVAITPPPPQQQPGNRFVIPPIAMPPRPFYEVPPQHDVIPYYNLCFKRVSNRVTPRNAEALVPLLKIIFASENLPVELVWLAEVESSFNPHAKSPAGARGLFQLMPATARALGLKTFPVDERVYAAKNTRAAARLLGMLYKRFGTWPLALAAYNAGEGRVAVALKRTPGAKTYAEIAAKLPAETRLYVPQVLATLVVRENVPLEKFVPSARPAVPAVVFPPPKSRT